MSNSVGTLASMVRRNFRNSSHITTMASMQLADHLAGCYIQRRKQRRGAMSLVVMGASLGDTRRQRQQRLRAIQRLDLALLIDTQHHRFGGRIEIEPHDVTRLGNKLRIARELERLLAMRLQAEGPPDATNRGLR